MTVFERSHRFLVTGNANYMIANQEKNEKKKR